MDICQEEYVSPAEVTAFENFIMNSRNQPKSFEECSQFNDTFGNQNDLVKKHKALDFEFDDNYESRHLVLQSVPKMYRKENVKMQNVSGSGSTESSTGSET